MKAEQRTTEELLDLMEYGDRGDREEASRMLVGMAADDAAAGLQAHIGRMIDIAKSGADFRGANPIALLTTLFPQVDYREEILDALLFLLENGDRFASVEARDALVGMIERTGKEDLLAFVDRIMDIAGSQAGSGGANATIVLAELLPCAGNREAILERLVDILENGSSAASWEAVYALMRTAVADTDGAMQAHAGRTMDIARSAADSAKIHAIYLLAKLFPRADNSDEILNTLLRTAEDADGNARRASLFSLADCISDDTKDTIVGVFENLLADEEKNVRFAALEVLTEALPHRIGDATLERIIAFLEADEVSIRWRGILAIDKAYPQLSAADKETAVRVLTQAIESEDIFVKVRAYQGIFNIRDSEQRSFPKVDAALAEESEFVRLWARYNEED